MLVINANPYYLPSEEKGVVIFHTGCLPLTAESKSILFFCFFLLIASCNKKVGKKINLDKTITDA